MPSQREHSPYEADPAAIRAFVVGTLIGMFVVGGFCAGTIWLLGGEPGGALVVGAVCAFWGGPGFGGMMGFIVHQDRMKRRPSIPNDPSPTSPQRT